MVFEDCKLQGTINSWSRSGTVGNPGGVLGRAAPPNTSTSSFHTVGHSWNKINNKFPKLESGEISLGVPYSISGEEEKEAH